MAQTWVEPMIPPTDSHVLGDYGDFVQVVRTAAPSLKISVYDGHNRLTDRALRVVSGG